MARGRALNARLYSGGDKVYKVRFRDGRVIMVKANSVGQARNKARTWYQYGERKNPPGIDYVTREEWQD